MKYFHCGGEKFQGTLFGLHSHRSGHIELEPDELACGLGKATRDLRDLPSSQLSTNIVAVEPRGLKHGLVATEALT
jgi:hypothetical protein